MESTPTSTPATKCASIGWSFWPRRPGKSKTSPEPSKSPAPWIFRSKYSGAATSAQTPTLLPRWRGVKYYGMVDDVEKRAVLRNSRALLFPVRWPEPFGIAITEALASGCAVFGTPYGSLPEIVDTKSGFLSNDASEIVEVIRTRQFSPEACRSRVYEGFTHLNMADSYLKLYESMLTTGKLPGRPQNPAPSTFS